MIPTTPQRKGTCENCEQPNITVFQMRNMWLCKGCQQTELDAIRERQTELQTIQQIKVAEQTLLDKSRHIDSLIELKSDVFNAQTVPFIQLKAEVDNNPDIPADEKDFAFVQICADRIAEFTRGIQADEVALVEKKNARFYWIKNAQEIVGRLKAEQKAKVKPLSLDYSSKPPKSIKPKPIKSPAAQSATGFNRQELKDATEKYSIPADKIRMYCLRHPGMSAEQAAKKLVELGWGTTN